MVDKRISGATSGATNMAKKYPIDKDGLTENRRYLSRYIQKMRVD